jgi:aldose 1-epimerase
MQVQKEIFGTLKNEDVFEYTLTNSNNVSLSVLTYGAIISKLQMPDKNGQVEDITMNVKTLGEMVETRPFHGAIIGRVSGRIANGEYTNGTKEVSLDQNEGENTLHGGHTGIDQHLWKAETEEYEDQTSLILTTVSPDGEGGFPGDVTVTVTYTLTEQNEVKLKYEATTNKRTLFNPTNHVYFNLNGDYNEPIYNHDIQVNSDKFAVLDDENIPTGELKDVDGTGFDMRTLTNVESVVKSADQQIVDRNGLDHPFVLNKEKDTPEAVLKEKDSGRVLKMKTDADAVVIFTHNSAQEPANEDEEILPVHGGITLETCVLPDAVNQENFGSIWLVPGEEFSSETTFTLSVE